MYIVINSLEVQNGKGQIYIKFVRSNTCCFIREAYWVFQLAVG